MSVTGTTNSSSYTGDGSTYTFPVGFTFGLNSDLVVTINGVTQVLGTVR